jgi:cysteinyl-tRNA synthetase
MDMKTLNVLRPNFNIHLSDYAQEIQAFIRDIVAKGRSCE